MKLWTNGTFYTMTAPFEKVDDVLTENGKIIATGSAAKQIQADEVIDLQGKIIFPGFVDSHIHLLWYGQALARLNLYQTKTKQAALAKIKERMDRLPEGNWLFVEGYDENKWQDEKTQLTKHDLDQISQTSPILVRRIDYHSVSINQAFIDEIQLTSDTPFSGGGEIDIDEMGEITGILRDNALNIAVAAFPEPTSAELEHWLTLAVEDLWEKGLTGAHSEDLHYFNGFEKTLATFYAMLSGEKKPFRVQLLVHHAELAAFKASNELFISGHPFVELGAMKIFYDGTVGSRTALMSAPYADDKKNYGLQIHKDHEFTELVKQAREANLPVAIHILGDQAFDNVITTLLKFPPKDGQFDRMIHTPWLREELLEKAMPLPLLFDLQPQFMSSDLPWALDVLGERHPPLAFAWKSIAAYGFKTAFGSDAPIEIPNPFYGIHAAVTRTTNQDLNGKRYFSDQALTVFEAIKQYTTGSAIASYKEFERGKILPGYVADFTIVEKDPYTVAEADLRDLKVTMTVVDGKIVYKC
ncbi:amidohydrolase [Listeria sp. PSOL-1]|uniref:amidohydrolase n=1 Tax=Listeria sp. PSOL-1 TaxID=1844999 RepID=UPI0013D6550B|nr:amidohydrolase [Listeria sp. PSOL-1]